MADYDDLLYSDYPHAETHPSRLFALGTLLGLRPAHPERCRVLELGCGLGGNLLAMGVALPGSHFLGVDLSAKQIAAGRETLRSLGLRNVELRALDLRDLRPEHEAFDYVLCHGLYSWVPPEVQERILELARLALRPSGVAYISYNTYPGWHMRGMLRDLLRRAAGEAGTPGERISRARGLLALLGTPTDTRSAAQAFLAAEVRLLDQLSDEYLFYEHLVERNAPCYFSDFAAAAARHGLSYLADAHCGSALPRRLGEEALRAARVPGDPIATEERLDLMEVRFFRRSLLCRSEDAPRDRSEVPPWERLEGLYLATQLTPLSDTLDLGSEQPEDFRGPGDRGVSAHRPILKAALSLLHEHRPRGLEFGALCAEAWALIGRRGARRRPPRAARAWLGESLIDLMTRGFVEIHAGAPAYVTSPGPRPRTTALCRLQASRGQAGITSLRHESIAVDELDRCLLRRLDGTFGVDELGELLLIASRSEDFTVEMNGQPVHDRTGMVRAAERRLAQLARSAFLLS